MAQNDGSIQIVGELDLKKVENSIDNLQRKIYGAATTMGVSIEGLTDKIKKEFDAMNRTIRNAGNDAARAAKAMTDDMDMDDDLKSYNEVKSAIKELERAFSDGEVGVGSYKKQLKDLREELQIVSYQAYLTGESLPKSNPLSLLQARKAEIGSLSTQEIQGYNVTELQQALDIMDSVIKKDGVSLEYQQRMVDLRGVVNERLKDSLKTTEQLTHEEANRLKKEQEIAKAYASRSKDSAKQAESNANSLQKAEQAQAKAALLAEQQKKAEMDKAFAMMESAKASEKQERLLKEQAEEQARLDELYQKSPRRLEVINAMEEKSVETIKAKRDALIEYQQKADVDIANLGEIEKNETILRQINELTDKIKTLNTIQPKPIDLVDINAMDETSIENITNKIKELQKYKDKFSVVDDKTAAENENLIKDIDRLNKKIVELNTIKAAPIALDKMTENNLVEMVAKVKAYKKALEELDDPLGDNAKQAAEFRNQINKLNRQMSRVNGTTQKTEGAMSRLSNGFKNLMTRMAFYVSVGALVGFAKQIIQVRGEFEKTTVALGSIIKDFDKANKLFLQVQQTALKSPFSIMELTKSTKQLAAYNIGVEDLHDTMKMLADLSAGVGTEMQRLVVNYGQIKALGVANNRELKDFAVAGLPVYEELANRFTVLEGRMVSAGEVFERVSNRMVSFQDVQAILENLTEEGGRFYNIQEEMSKTMAGRLSNLTDAYQVMYNEIGERGQGVIIGFINLFKGLAENWEKLIPLAHALGIAIAGWGINKAVINMKALGVAATIATQKIFHLKTTMKASTTINPWVALATVVLSVGAAIYGAVKEANRFNKELDKIKTDGDAKIEELTLRFKILADTIKNAGDGTTEQREAYEELQRTFGDILPSQTLEIENLKNQTDGYKALTEAIRDNIKSKTLEKSLSAIKAEYADDISKQTSRLKEALSKGQGFYSGAEKLTESQASRVVSAVSESIRNGSIDLQNYKYELRNIIKEQTGLSVSILDYNNNTIFSLYEMIKKTTKMNDKLKETEQIYNLSDTSLGYLNDKWDNIKNSANKYRQEQNEILANAKTLGKLETTELEFKLKTDKEEMGKYVAGVNEIIQDELNKQTNIGKDIKLEITADTDVFSKDFKAELSKLDSTSQTLVGNLLKRFSAIRGKLIPTDEFEISMRSLKKVLGTIEDAQIKLDDLSSFVKGDTETFIDYIGRIHSNLKEQEEIVNSLNVQLANSTDLSKERQDKISQDLLKANQKLQVLKEMAELYPQLEAKKDTTDAYSKQVSLIKELVTEFRKLAVANQDVEKAITDVESAYNDVFSELFKGKKFDMANLLTFNDKDVVSAIKTLQKQFAKDSKQYLSLGKLVAEYELKISASIEEQKLNEAEQELQELFDTYKVNVEIGTMGEYGDLMASIFDVDKIDLKGLESRINKVLEQFDSNYTKTIANLESKAVAEKDPEKKQNLENEIANMKAANSARIKLKEDADKKLRDLELDEDKRSANRFIKLAKDYATYEQRISAIRKQGILERADIDKQLASGKIKEVEADRLKAASKNKEEQLVSSIKLEEVQGLDKWARAFGDTDKIATKHIDNMIKMLEDFIAANKKLSPTELKQIKDQIQELEQLKIDRSIFGNLFGSFEDLKTSNKGLRDLKKDVKATDEDIKEKQAEVAKANDRVAKSFTKIGSSFNSLADITSTIGGFAEMFGANDETLEIFGDIGATFGGIGKAAQGVGQIMSGDILGGISSILSGIFDIFKAWGDNTDNAILRDIEDSEKALKKLDRENRKLEHTYNQLKRAIDKSLGSGEIAARKAAIAQQELMKQNAILRKQELEKQIALQKSRDLKEGTKDDKKRDKEVEELEDKLQDVNEEIDNLTNNIEDAVDDIANTLLGNTLKGAAEGIASSFLDAWRSGEDPFKVIDEQFQDMIDNMIVKAIAGQVVAAKLKKIFDMVQAATEGDDKIDEDEIKDIAEAGKGVSKEIGEELKALMEALGIGFGSGAASSLSELQKGIQGMSEEQGGALESLWTTSVANSFTIINIISNSLAVQNAQLNELRSGNQVRAAIYALLQSTTSEDGLALRVDLRN